MVAADPPSREQVRADAARRAREAVQDSHSEAAAEDLARLRRQREREALRRRGRA